MGRKREGRFFGLVLLVILVMVLALSGCGEKEAEESTGAGESAATESTAAAETTAGAEESLSGLEGAETGPVDIYIEEETLPEPAGEDQEGSSGEGNSGGDGSEDGSSRETEAETEEETSEEETTEAETERGPLESLSGLAVGTILSEEDIDFDDLGRYFMSWKIEEGDNLHARIEGKSYRKNPSIGLSDLRYLKMPHYNFDGNIQVGEMIVNAAIEEDVLEVFQELFEAEYPIESMILVDEFWTGDPDTTDSASIDVNNTSAFCYRKATGSGNLSNHALGRAIDLNPQQNPYVSYSSGKPRWSHSNANDYIDRDSGLPHVITHDDLAYKVFKEHGFTWGGDWNNPKDYQHFEKR